MGVDYDELHELMVRNAYPNNDITSHHGGHRDDDKSPRGHSSGSSGGGFGHSLCGYENCIIENCALSIGDSGGSGKHRPRRRAENVPMHYSIYKVSETTASETRSQKHSVFVTENTPTRYRGREGPRPWA
jgi:hypothetical protein